MITSVRTAFTAMPPQLKSCLRRAKNAPRRIRYVMRPRKCFQTLCYHTYFYRLLRRPFPGIHLGSGGWNISGYLNLDVDVRIDCDVVARSEKIKLGRGTVDVLYASHLFEHIPKARAKVVLNEWRRVLRPDGRLYLCVPDLEVLAELYLEALRDCDSAKGRERLALVSNVIYGDQSDAYDFHYAGYSLASLKLLLESVGFTDVRRFDRATAEFGSFNDCGNALIGDRLVSLNLVAVR